MFAFLWNYIYGYEAQNDNVDESSKPKAKEAPSKLIKKTLVKQKNPTNFYFLSLIKENDGTWSIHGLWPQDTLTHYPSFCKNVEFDIELLNPIMSSLKHEWYSNRGADEIFWKHEYLKHGTCNFNDFNEFQYFKTTLDLFDKAKSLDLPERFYNRQTDKCLIPVNQKLEFFEI